MKNIFIATFIVLLISACNDDYNRGPASKDLSTGNSSTNPSFSGDQCKPNFTDNEVCKLHCGTFEMNNGCENHKYDCAVACPISQTCDSEKHKCCVDISRKLDLFCKYYPYHNSTYPGAGTTPSHDAETRIPSPGEVGYLYCSYPSTIDCSKY